MLTMRKLGKKGRFANQLFQYAYLRQKSKDYQCPFWIGQVLFKLDDPAPTAGTPELSYKFPLHSSYYNKKLFKSLFRPKFQLRQMIDCEINLRKKGRPLVGIHLRRGDYGTFKRKSARWCFVAPTKWYLDWLAVYELSQNYIGNKEKPVIFIASEEAETLSDDFKEYKTFYWKGKNFYWDFYTLTQSDYLLISNSTFGFAASMLNDKAKAFYRPRLSEKKLIPYDPWDSPLIFKDEKY